MLGLDFAVVALRSAAGARNPMRIGCDVFSYNHPSPAWLRRDYFGRCGSTARVGVTSVRRPVYPNMGFASRHPSQSCRMKDAVISAQHPNGRHSDIFQSMFE